MATATTAKGVRPNWYTKDDDTAWEKVKAAFQRDWQQTKHDMGGNEPDLNQDVGDTISQATGSQHIPPANVPNPPTANDAYNAADEPAYRYGYAASRHYADRAEWNDEVEATLQKDWDDQQEWLRRREAVRRGWRYYRSNSSLSDTSGFKTV